MAHRKQENSKAIGCSSCWGSINHLVENGNSVWQGVKNVFLKTPSKVESGWLCLQSEWETSKQLYCSISWERLWSDSAAELTAISSASDREKLGCM